ncbi:DUF6385 domain-containing protein [Anaerotignum sp.]|uniref:DUF6385 domain-containing protein n=1 Tax=Anaerotignum sp. TaxID=2039241 RepID=UPI00332FBAAB
MKNAVPISIKKFDTFGIVYFNIENFFDSENVESAYLSLEVCGNTDGEEIQCYLNDDFNSWVKRDLTMKKSNDFKTPWRKEVLLDISENYHLLASGIKENNGMIVAYGNNQVISSQLLICYKKDIIVPKFLCEPYFDKKLYISSRQKEAFSPYFLMATVKMLTIWVENLGEHPINVALANSPDAKKSATSLQWTEVVPNEIIVLNPKYFSKYVRAILNSSQKGIIANVWFQSQLAR